MKKNVLALSISAALVSFGFAGGAQAATTAASLELSPAGTGHMLLVPYYSTQAGNATLINITNTDTINGKAVKVRFRGASNSDDVFDFQVFLSPGDVWTANVSKGADGRATLTTADNSCTKPGKTVLNSTGFVTARLDQTLTGDALANQTREGYVEIFNMADISPTLNSSLYADIKHVSSVPPCANGKNDTAWTDLDTFIPKKPWDVTNPTTGLMANWIIINVNDAGAWSGQATAVVAIQSGTPVAAGSGNVVYWPQISTSVAAIASSYTADPLMTQITSTDYTAPAIAASSYDLPDMSTPYVTGVATPSAQAGALSNSISTTGIINEFLTVSAIHATTDWTLSMPTRRYSVAFDYVDGSRVFNPNLITYFTSANTVVVNRQICVNGMTASTWDQEENQPAPGGVVISPSQPVPGIVFCGEAGVMSINNGGSTTPSGTLKATVARSGLDNAYGAGWISIATPAASSTPATPVGLPVLGAAFLRATAATGTYGVTWDHRNSRLSLQ